MEAFPSGVEENTMIKRMNGKEGKKTIINSRKT